MLKSPEELIGAFKQLPPPSEETLQMIRGTEAGQVARSVHPILSVSPRTGMIGLLLAQESKAVRDALLTAVNPKFRQLDIRFWYFAPASLVSIAEAQSYGDVPQQVGQMVQGFYNMFLKIGLPHSSALRIQEATRQTISLFGEDQSGFGVIDTFVEGVTAILRDDGVKNREIIESIMGLGSERYKLHYTAAYGEIPTTVS